MFRNYSHIPTIGCSQNTIHLSPVQVQQGNNPLQQNAFTQLVCQLQLNLRPLQLSHTFNHLSREFVRGTIVLKERLRDNETLVNFYTKIGWFVVHNL
jgi:hypothetical protein